MTTSATTAATGDPFLTVPNVLADLSISRQTFYSFVKKGALKTIKLGGSTRIRLSELERFKSSLDAPSDAEALQ